MNRDEIIDKLTEKGYTKKDAGFIIDDFTTIIAEALAQGEEVALHGFGTFSVVKRAERNILDYQTKEIIRVPSQKAPKFAPGKRLLRAVREGFVRP